MVTPRHQDRRPPRKRWSQNFLNDSAVAEKIIRAVTPTSEDLILEVGPGRGVLTEKLVGECRQLVAVEIDPTLCEELSSEFKDRENFRCLQADILTLDLAELLNGTTKRLRVVSNVPYSISSDFLQQLCKFSHCISDAHLLLQAEVVDRVAAAPGNRTYGALTVLVAASAISEPLFRVLPGSFRPSPAVQSRFLRISFPEDPPVKESRNPDFHRFVQVLFSRRRKMLQNALEPALQGTSQSRGAFLSSHGFDPSRRPETLSVQQLAGLWRVLPRSHS